MSSAVADRLSFRVAPEVKTLVDRAAALVGLTSTAFAVSTLTEQARRVVEAHEATTLSARDFDRFLAALDAPVEPTDSLLKAVQSHGDLVGK